ncbi:hypothetical protein AURDEDRAFT_188246 [Auricularia subglabra TFB-10046 SS5]|nr:hypothetical protein AURDEDRAFT_188246 [Auricularia subglabra TFB-10046 SS5]
MCAPSLPVDVVRLLLEKVDYLKLDHVVRMSHVSHTWRIAARSHPLYARDITLPPLENLSRGAVLFFLDRLAAGGSLQLKIFMGVGTLSENSRATHDFRTMVIPALARSLDRLVTLAIQCDADLIPDMLAALCTGAAPRLEVFQFYPPVHRPRPSYVMPVVPPDLFSRHAPQLRELQMEACQFPETAPVAALAHVRLLIYEVDNTAGIDGLVSLHPERFFVSCPALEELYIEGGGLDVKHASWDACPPPSVTKLLHLTLTSAMGNRGTEVFVRTFAHPGMQSISVETAEVNAATVDLMIGTLDDCEALHLDIDGDVDELKCSVLDAARSRRRTFVHQDIDMESLEEDPADLFVDAFARIARRFTCISVTQSACAWNYLVALFSEEDLIRVETLKIMPTSDRFEDFDPEPERTLTFPALREIELVSEFGMRGVDVDDLLFLVDGMLDFAAGRRLRLVLKNVRLDGDTNLLSDRFEDVSPSAP